MSLLLIPVDLPLCPWKWRQQYILISFECLLCDWTHQDLGHLLNLSSVLLSPMWYLPCPNHLTAYVTLSPFPFLFIHKLGTLNSSKPKNIKVKYLYCPADLHGSTMLNISETEMSMWCWIPCRGELPSP